MEAGDIREAQRKYLEDLEDALETALAAAKKVHISVPYAFTPLGSHDSSESVADLLRRARGPIRERLNAVYAQEIRKQRGRE